MKRKFKVTIGKKTFIMEVEEITGATSLTHAAPKLSLKQPAEDQTPAIPKALSPAPVSTPNDEGVVKAPMPGVVISIKCKVKSKVKTGDLLLTLEAMKMENEIHAPKSGIVKRIEVSEKDTVNYGDVLVEID